MARSPYRIRMGSSPEANGVERRYFRAPPWIRGKARELRKSPTEAEERLWQALRASGTRWRRQHPVGRVILDFYCAPARLCVEVDGDVHLDPLQAERDCARTSHLQSLGIRVLRFRNAEVMEDISAVLARVRDELGE